MSRRSNFGQLAVSLCLVAGSARALPLRFDLLCNLPGTKEVNVDTWSIYRLDLAKRQWCQDSCPEESDLSVIRNTVVMVDGAQRKNSLDMRLNMSNMRIYTHTFTNDPGNRWIEYCKLRPFSGFRERPRRQ